MPTKLSPAWMFSQPIDEEHKQYVLLAYLRDVMSEIEAGLLEPCTSDLRMQLQNVECFLSVGGLLGINHSYNEEEIVAVEYVTSLPSGHRDRDEILRIAGWSLKRMRVAQKHVGEIWRGIESEISINMIGAGVKTRGGFFFVRYPGSYIVETYRFERVGIDINLYFVAFDENLATDYMDVAAKYYDSEASYLSVEPTRQMSTERTVVPIVEKVVRTRVIDWSARELKRLS